jgi:hypothetical protein
MPKTLTPKNDKAKDIEVETGHITEPTKSLEELAADPNYDLLGSLPEDQLTAFFEAVGADIQKRMADGDQILQILYRPGSEETFFNWYLSYQFIEDPQVDQAIRQSIQVQPDARVRDIYINTKSQFEFNWLVQYFTDNGFLKHIEAKRCPISIGPADLKMLYLVDVLLQLQSNRIVTAPGTGLFTPDQLKVRTKQ